MRNVRRPQFLENLYRDMRDRHLLLPAVLLIVALIAVPILLGSQSSRSVPPTSTSGTNASASAATPAVVTREIGVTNYRKRLEELQTKNPFHQQYTQPSAEAALNATSTGGAGSASATGDVSGTSVSGSTSSVSGSQVASPSPSISAGSSGGTSSSPPQTTHVPKPQLRAYAWRVSVKVGEPGHLKERPEVQRLAMLPSQGKPVATFIGATETGDKALFVVSPEVDSVKGDARCLPSSSSCRFVVMKPGDKANFHYAPNGKRYNLVLVDTHAVVVHEKILRKGSGDASPQAKLPQLGPG
jgi:hypothetical protein